MASLRRLPRSPNFIACFTGSDGKRYQRSTGVRADGKVTSRRSAQKIADEFEEIARRRKTVAQVQRVIQDLFEEVNGEALPNSSLRLFASNWLQHKEAEVSSSSFRSYRDKVTSFLDHLGTRADEPISAINKHDVLRWRDAEAARVSPSTVNHSLKVLRVFMEAACRDGLIPDNPAEAVARLKDSGKKQRRPFSLPEIQRLAQAADDEWKSMILFGLYTGQRLGDIASLTWGHLDLDNQELRLVTKKTSRNQKIPLPPPLLKFILAQQEAPRASGPVHPRAWAIVNRQRRVGTLSRQFRDLMVKAGLIPKEKHRKGKNCSGQQGQRQESEISFHSLRHTTTSLLKNAGVSPAITEEFVGHDSAEMNRHYTHIELDAMRRAAETLPDVMGMPLEEVETQVPS